MTALSDELKDHWSDVYWWLTRRKQAALKIAPETAQVIWAYADLTDPYGVNPPGPGEHRTHGRAFFAREPRSEIWVSFFDLPEATREALWRKHHASRFNDDLAIDKLFLTEPTIKNMKECGLSSNTGAA